MNAEAKKSRDLTPEELRIQLEELRDRNPHAFKFGMQTVAYRNGTIEAPNFLTLLPDPKDVKRGTELGASLAPLIGASEAQVRGWSKEDRHAYAEVVSLGSRFYPDKRVPSRLPQSIA